jgi:hypothetical protein
MAETVEVTEPLSVAAQPAHKLADYVTSMQAKAFPAMSGIELGDIMIPGKRVCISFRRLLSIEHSDRIIHSGHDDMDGIEIIRSTR